MHNGEVSPGRQDDPDELLEAVLVSSRALVAVSARSIAAAQGVTLPQFRMLVVLSQASLNLSGLAEELDVAPSTAMRMVDRLVAGALVVREVHPQDRRQTWVVLTAAGRRTVDTVTARRRRDLRAILDRVPADERQSVLRGMKAFATAADSLWSSAAPAGDPGPERAAMPRR